MVCKNMEKYFQKIDPARSNCESKCKKARLEHQKRMLISSDSSNSSDGEPCKTKSNGDPVSNKSDRSVETQSDNDDIDFSCNNNEPDTNKQKRRYTQKVRRVWLKDKRLKDWIAEDEEKIFCKYCGCKLQAKLCGLLAHSTTSKHIGAAAPLLRGKQPAIPFKPVKTETNIKKAELCNALYVACHTAIQSVDHLTKFQKNAFCDSEISAGMKLSRTKCSALIKNILSPYFKKRLLTDIGNNKFSLIIDESTDVSVKKYLGIVIRYYSTNTKSVINTFLKLEDLEDFTAQGIVAAILKTLQEFHLDMKNLIGLGTDNASVMVGVNRGVIALLKKHNPDIILVPCVCHSIQLAVSSASKFIPNEIEFLVAETYNWFSKSSARQKQYENIFAAINDGLEPLKIVRACDTRWLSIEIAVKRIVDQWLELKTQFGIASAAECCHKAKLLANIYNDINLAYLQFLKPILQDVQKVNKLFESNHADPLKIFNELNILLSNLCFLIVARSEDFDPLHSPLAPYLISVPHFHYCFEEFVRNKKNENIIDTETEKIIRENCRKFLTNLIEQLRQRLPNSIGTLKKMDFFSVENALKMVKPNVFVHFDKEKYKYNSDEITAIEMQWQRLTSYQWMNLHSTVEFWAEIREFKNALRENPFSQLANFVFKFLILPLSNAEVERIFSAMNLVKTKQRNRTSIKMLNSILCIRCGLKREGKCCHNFNVEVDLIKMIDSCDIYSDSSDDENVIFDI